MALLGLIIGVIGAGVTVTAGIVAYRGRMRTTGDGLYSIPTGAGIALAFVIIGAVITIGGLVVAYLAA